MAKIFEGTMKIDNNPRCDFCGEKDPIWTFIAKPFQAPTLLGPAGLIFQYMDEEWAACTPCKVAVEWENIDALMERVFSSTDPALEPPDPRAKAFLVALWTRMFKNRTGPAIYDPGPHPQHGDVDAHGRPIITADDFHAILQEHKP